MLEELASHCIWDKCCSFAEVIPNPRFNPRYRSPEYDRKIKLSMTATDFIRDEDCRTRFDTLPRLTGKGGVLSWGKRNVRKEAWYYVNDNSVKIIDGFIRDVYSGDWLKAMKDTKHYENLHDAYLKYFNERREHFMENEKQMVAVSVEKLTRQGRKPASHGGVANLLTVLTRTMQDQGSSILTIAKVQYAICVQAGIMLPNEFLTDVLVADAIIRGDE